MCTATWIRRPDGYDLFFNRDERVTRQPAAPPAVHQRGGVAYIAPQDGDFGGSWISVNGWGLSLILLNGYQPLDAEPRDYVSRGLLLLELTDCASGEEMGERLRGRELSPYRAFWLASFAPAEPTRLARWEHGTLELTDLPDEAMPLVSSSFASEIVRRSRRDEFRAISAAGPGGVERHLAYHRSHRPERGPRSPCMHRPEGQTVSFSRIEVDASSARFYYVPHAPCLGLPTRPAATLHRQPTRPATRAPGAP